MCTSIQSAEYIFNQKRVKCD